MRMSEEEKRKKRDTDKNQDKSGDNRKKKEHAYRKGYYINQPVFGRDRTSWIKQQFGKSVAIFLAAVACIFLYFLLLRVDEVSGIAGKIVSVSKPIIYGLAIAYLLNPIVKAVDRRMLPLLESRFPKLKKKQSLKTLKK